VNVQSGHRQGCQAMLKRMSPKTIGLMSKLFFSDQVEIEHVSLGLHLCR